jgi:hypothetical protein
LKDPKPEARALLAELVRLRSTFGDRAASRRKVALIAALAQARLPTAKLVLELHDALLYLRALPDDRAVLRAAEDALARFEERSDLARVQDELEDSGIAGTVLRFPYFWFTARWIASRWPRRIAIDWERFEKAGEIERLLPQLLPEAETLTLDSLTYAPRAWLRLLKSPRETDAAFLIRRFDAMPATSVAREAAYDGLGPTLVLSPGPDTPSRTRDRRPGARVAFQRAPLRGGRPDLVRASRARPLRVREVSAAQGEALIGLARAAMITRSRDLDAFENADPRDVRLVDLGEGLELAMIGVRPERRLLLEAVYGFLTIQNGVPIGYVLASALFESSEVAYNVFDTWRGAESAHVYGRVLGMLRALFGSTTFAVDPYQLGHDNDEGLASGAWWFYRKLGFRPRDPRVQRLARREEARLARNPRARSSTATLQRLSAAFMFLDTGAPQREPLGKLALENVGLHVTRFLARGWGSERERGVRACVAALSGLCELGRLADWTPEERAALERWAPLALSIPGLARWPRRDLLALGRVIRSKGGRRESTFVQSFDAHARLRAAILRLASGRSRVPFAPKPDFAGLPARTTR